MRKLSTAFSLSLTDWLLLGRAWLLLLWVDLLLRWRPFDHARAWATPGPLPSPPPPQEDGRTTNRAEIRRIVRLLDSAARYHLYPMRCLRRALVLQRLLWQRGVASDLRLGVNLEDGRFTAHAWLEQNGIPLAEPAGALARYAPLRPQPVRAGRRGITLPERDDP
jgi:hypothetical protein